MLISGNYPRHIFDNVSKSGWSHQVFFDGVEFVLGWFIHVPSDITMVSISKNEKGERELWMSLYLCYRTSTCATALNRLLLV